MIVMEIFRKLKVINVGARKFHDSLREQEADSVHVAWEPPAGGDRETTDLLEELKGL